MVGILPTHLANPYRNLSLKYKWLRATICEQILGMWGLPPGNFTAASTKWRARGSKATIILAASSSLNRK